MKRPVASQADRSVCEPTLAEPIVRIGHSTAKMGGWRAGEDLTNVTVTLPSDHNGVFGALVGDEFHEEAHVAKTQQERSPVAKSQKARRRDRQTRSEYWPQTPNHR